MYARDRGECIGAACNAIVYDATSRRVPCDVNSFRATVQARIRSLEDRKVNRASRLARIYTVDFLRARDPETLAPLVDS